ncbi:MFS transporter [Pseudonocardia zijingensis]|uniref:MFS transporter n=1 Tax=Pseudonocardia zijingensis TaxID=153376 RepID=A0ABN1NA91_9PSEU
MSATRLQGWAVTLAAAGAAVVVFLDKALVGLVAQPLTQELGISSTAYGAVGSASYVLNVVTCLVVGLAPRAVGPRWGLLVCGLLWAVGQAPAALAGTAGLLVVSRLVVGAAEGPAVPLAYTATYSWFPARRRGLPAAVITSGSSFAKIALLPLVTLLVVHLGWRAGFVAVGVVALLWCAIWLAVGRMGPEAQAPAAERVRPDWRLMLRNPTMLACLAATFCQGALAAVVFTWLPSYFQAGLGFSQTTAGTLFALPSVMGVLALFAVGTVGDRMLRTGRTARAARGLVGGVCLTLAGVLLMLLPAVDAPVAAVAVVVLAYGLSVTVNTVTYPMIGSLVPPSTLGNALAVLTAASGVAGIVSPLAAGVILDTRGDAAGGYDLAFLVFGAVQTVGGLLFWWFARPERDAVRPPVAEEVAP